MKRIISLCMPLLMAFGISASAGDLVLGTTLQHPIALEKKEGIYWFPPTVTTLPEGNTALFLQKETGVVTCYTVATPSGVAVALSPLVVRVGSSDKTVYCKE